MPKTLLLADDSVTIQKVVGISFANEDVRIVTVDNGDDAVTRAQEILPDIVLADVVMPGKSGYDVCAALKADPKLAAVPVLLLTGTFETFDEERAARVGADGHITKPFEAQALVELVSARLASAARKPAAPAPVVVVAPAATEPEPFDFLEPPDATQRRGGTGSARPVAPADDVFAFEAEPIDLETEDEADVDLGNEATAARTALLFDDELDPLAEAETTPPVASRPAPPLPREDAADDITRLVLPAEEAAPDAGDPLGALGEELAEPMVPAPDAAAAWDVSSDELSDPFSTQVLGAESPAPAARYEAPAAPPAFEDPLFDEDDAAAEFDLGEPAAAAPSPVASVSAAPAAMTEPAPSELSDVMRTQMHETLEKIAWEALGDVSDRIVREAVARIEQVAWEVIPRLAETLIREEIRKLKGEE